ncbi:MAG: cytochrome c3 family protein, partial [Geminicoccaceae bacterium]
MSADLVDPGTLYTGHAEIENCADCHVAFNTGPVGWVKAAFAASNPIADSDKCLDCHKWGDNALNPHSVARPELADLTSKFYDKPESASDPWTVQVSRSLFPIPSETHNGTLACGTCHKEHVGEEANLVEVTNARCQSCHELAFHAFSDGHPSFGDYPYLQRTRVIFDHDSHNRKNFPEKVKQGVKPPETCDSCHMPDGTGRFMLTADFDDTCTECHSEDIMGETVAGPKGTPIIAVPELDLLTLQERGIAIGEWPDAPIAFDISAYTKLLIAADSRIADDLLVIEDTDLQDLTDASDAELQAVGRVAWSIKELLFDLTISGMEVLENKVEASLDAALDTDTLGRLVGHIPQDVVAAAGQAWFPNLKQEVVAYRAVKPASVTVPGAQGEAADDTLSGQGASNETGLSDQGGIILAQASTIQVEELPDESAEENEALGLPTLDPEEWAKAGGWYRKDYVLYYRPVGHEDVVLRTWLDISARSFGTPAERYGDALFQLLADKNTPGKCTKCHSVDQQQGGGLEVNWSPFEPLAGETKFTNFVHATHFSAVGDEGCIACHQLNEDTKYQETYKGRNPLEFVSNFAPMKRQTCAECHVEQSA